MKSRSAPAGMMDVQKWATQRNELLETIVTEALEVALCALKVNKIVESYERPSRQKEYLASNCQTVFDNFFRITPRGFKLPVEVWIQITYYKGNGNKSEANKTYEAKETLIEGLFLASEKFASKKDYRLIHITIGDSAYSYGWIRDLKKSIFDRSIEIAISETDKSLSNFLLTLVGQQETLLELKQSLSAEAKRPESPIAHIYKCIKNDFLSWGKAGFPVSSIGRDQARLILAAPESSYKDLIEKSAFGEDIKGRSIKLIAGEKQDDELLVNATAKVLSKAPFLAEAVSAVGNWSKYLECHLPDPEKAKSLLSYVRTIWLNEAHCSLLFRRLLMRLIVGVQESNYIQDLGIKGISEHNLYIGSYNEVAGAALVNRVCEGLVKEGITTPEQLYKVICSGESLAITAQSLSFESKNGTSLKPSLFYVQEALSSEYAISKSSVIGYHSQLTNASVKSFDNLFLVSTKGERQEPLAYLKAKYFRRQEFARRAKEESFVALMGRFQYISSKKEFDFRSPKLPFIMFVDKGAGFSPQSYALRMLVDAGWVLFFSVNHLRNFLETLKNARKR